MLCNPDPLQLYLIAQYTYSLISRKILCHNMGRISSFWFLVEISPRSVYLDAHPSVLIMSNTKGLPLVLHNFSREVHVYSHGLYSFLSYDLILQF